ncbi:MAG: MarR family transcriptional regulator [Clostridia bacterium]|nr:MarR family transcriptional regulator [Clostridia bacterium]
MTAYDQINSFLVDIWSRIGKIEERALTAGLESDVSITEIHILEKIGDNPRCRMSEIARALGVTLATLTVACDKLVSKDLISRERDARDKRVVIVSLTPKGMAAYDFHKRFHDRMIDAAISGMDDDEQRALGRALDKLQTFFEELAEA